MGDPSTKAVASVHRVLQGLRDAFSTIRTVGEFSGCDFFECGPSSGLRVELRPVFGRAFLNIHLGGSFDLRYPVLRFQEETTRQTTMKGVSLSDTPTIRSIFSNSLQAMGLIGSKLCPEQQLRVPSRVPGLWVPW